MLLEGDTGPGDRFPSEGISEVTWEVTLATPPPPGEGSPCLTEGSLKPQSTCLTAGQFVRFILQNSSSFQHWGGRLKVASPDEVGLSFSTSHFGLS